MTFTPPKKYKIDVIEFNSYQNKMEIVEQTKQLPNEIVNTILEYQGYDIWRNGKFICRKNTII